VVAALILLDDDAEWQSTGGMVDFVLEFLIERIDDPGAVQRMREIVDNNLGSLWLTEFPPAARTAALEHLSRDLVPVAERDLPASDRRDDALAAFRALADLAASRLV
jgi:hypothetical protein